MATRRFTSFGEAFAKARKELGAGKTFTWNGKTYTTDVAGEDKPRPLTKEELKATAAKPSTGRFSGPSYTKEQVNKGRELINSSQKAREALKATAAKPRTSEEILAKREESKFSNQKLRSVSPEDLNKKIPAKPVVAAKPTEEEEPSLWDAYNPVSYVDNLWSGFTQRFLPKYQEEDPGAKLVVSQPKTIPSLKDTRPNLIPEGYTELGVVRDYGKGAKPTDSLVSFTNRFSNDTGGNYLIGHKANEVSPNKSMPGRAVAHFLMDADILPDQKNYKGYYGTSEYVPSRVPGKFINSPANMGNPNAYVMGTRPGANGTTNVIYRKVDEISPEERQNYNFEIGVRNIPYSAIGWDKEGESTGYQVKSSFIPDLRGGNTSIPYRDKGSYSRFSGGAGIYAFRDPQTGERVAVDAAGSTNALRDIGSNIMKQYNVSPDSLQFLYHDMGSYSAKPKGQNGNLNYNQWGQFNTYNKGYSGAPMIIPQMPDGGAIKGSFFGRDKPNRPDPTYDAISSVLMNRNRGKNFVDRAYNYENSPILIDPEQFGGYRSHFMGYDVNGRTGASRVYPQVVQEGNPNGLRLLGEDEAWDYADNTGEYLEVPSARFADYLSNKGYKKATGMPTYESGGKFAVGGTYNISEEDIQSLINQGYKIERI